MDKTHGSTAGLWSWPAPVTFRHGVRCGQMIWLAGQADVAADGRVNHPGDLAAQTRGAMANLARALATLGGEPDDLVKLLCFYANDGTVDETRFLEMVAAALPATARPAVTAVPVAYLAAPGALVEIEGYAMRGEDGMRLPRRYGTAEGLSPLPAGFAHALRCGKMVFVSGQSAEAGDGAIAHPGDSVAQTELVMRQIGRALESLGCDFDDVVKSNRWYLGHGTVEDFEPAALACARNYKEPGPAATGVPLPRFARAGQAMKIEAVAMRGEDGARLKRRHVWPPSLWDWTIHLPYHHGLKCHDMIFLGGQVSLDKQGQAVHENDMAAQTRQAMTHIGTILGALGAGFADVCKLTTVYAGPSGLAAIQENLAARSAFFTAPGPAATSIPLPVLAYPAMVIEIDTFAMAEPDAD